jgi:hypothetical protein
MKKVNQLVALMFVLLLAAPSVLADVPCVPSSNGDHAPTCCILTDRGMRHQLAADCHESMSTETIATECNQSGCEMTAVKVVAQAFATSESRVDGAAFSASTIPIPALFSPGLFARSFESSSPPGKAKYLLFQVFRI